MTSRLQFRQWPSCVLCTLLILAGNRNGNAAARADELPAQPVQIGSGRKKLIEFGWDEPDAAFLRKHQQAVERTPFDGCVYHVSTSVRDRAPENFTWLCWGRRRFTERELEGSLHDLESITWTRFDSNFLRFNVTPADLDWFDDHQAVLSNAQLAARLARAGHSRGILLDTEQYGKPLFNYANQRDSGKRLWSEYAAEARRRGREVMSAFQQGYPGLTVFLTFGPSLLWGQSNQGKKPLAECDYGLLVSFVNGLIEAARGQARIVDGYELSYGYRQAEQFRQAHEVIRVKTAELLADPAAYRRVVSAGFGLWLDHDRRDRGWRTDQPDANYFSPEGFRSALRLALEQADEYVWVYSETPRFWTDAGKSAALSEAYIDSIKKARQGLCRDD